MVTSANTNLTSKFKYAGVADDRLPLKKRRIENYNQNQNLSSHESSHQNTRSTQQDGPPPEQRNHVFPSTSGRKAIASAALPASGSASIPSQNQNTLQNSPPQEASAAGFSRKSDRSNSISNESSLEDIFAPIPLDQSAPRYDDDYIQFVASFQFDDDNSPPITATTQRRIPDDDDERKPAARVDTAAEVNSYLAANALISLNALHTSTPPGEPALQGSDLCIREVLEHVGINPKIRSNYTISDNVVDQLKQLQSLVNQGAINYSKSRKETRSYDIIATAVKAGNFPAVKILLAGNEEVKARFHGSAKLRDQGSRAEKSLLSLCVEHNNPEMLKYLINHKASNGRGFDINGSDSTPLGLTPLTKASALGLTGLIKILKQHKNINVTALDGQGWHALIHAAHHGDMASVVELINTKPRIHVNTLSSDGKTALQFAEENNQAEVANYLRQETERAKTNIAAFKFSNPAEPSNKNVNWVSRGGETCLKIAARSRHLVSKIQPLIDAGAVVDFMPRGGWSTSALGNAIEYNNIAAMKILLAAGANPNLRQGDGSTYLHSAVRRPRVDAVRLLLESNANYQIRNGVNQTGQTPLEACRDQYRFDRGPAEDRALVAVEKLLMGYDQRSKVNHAKAKR